jgi:hypothetical protein
MMILETQKQYVGRELCERMVELGAPTDSACVWLDAEAALPRWRIVARWETVVHIGIKAKHGPAYSVPELLAVLPLNSAVERCGGHYEAHLNPLECDRFRIEEGGTAADALAKLWIELHTPNPLTTDTETT